MATSKEDEQPGWVTVRFTDDDPVPKKIWSKSLDESYELCRPPGRKTTR